MEKILKDEMHEGNMQRRTRQQKKSTGSHFE